MLMGPVKLMGQARGQNIAMTSFIAPQVGPSMAPAFLFAAQAPAQDQTVQPVPIAPTPVVPAPAVVAAPPVVETTPAVPLVSIDKQIIGPVAVIAIIAGIIAWKA